MKTKDLTNCLVEPLSDLIEKNNLNETYKSPIEQEKDIGRQKLISLENFTSQSQVKVNLKPDLRDQQKKSVGTNCKYELIIREIERLVSIKKFMYLFENGVNIFLLIFIFGMHLPIKVNYVRVS